MKASVKLTRVITSLILGKGSTMKFWDAAVTFFSFAPLFIRLQKHRFITIWRNAIRPPEIATAHPSLTLEWLCLSSCAQMIHFYARGHLPPKRLRPDYHWNLCYLQALYCTANLDSDQMTKFLLLTVKIFYLLVPAI